MTVAGTRVGDLRPGVRYFEPALETAEREVIRSHQWQRLVGLLRELWSANPFYRRKWLAAGLRGAQDIRDWEDFFRLPLTTKQELVDDQRAHPPYGTNLTYPPDAYVRLHQTSGTTGLPLRWLDTAHSWDWWARLWSYVYTGAGVGAGDRVFLAFSFGPFIGFWAAFAAARRLGLLAIPAGGMESLARLQAIQKLQPTVLVCTPSYALHLAEVAAQAGIDLASSSVRVSIHAGEPGAAIEATRRRIEQAWGAKAYDHTGATEVGATGFECVAQQGTHLIETEFVFEVIDPATGHPAAEGEAGELVVTNLGRPGMPVVRYRTGDLVRLNLQPCECGRTLARMMGGIIGRADDMITVRGVNVFPSAIENVVREFREIVEFQIETYRRGAMDEVRIKIELAPDLPLQVQEQVAKRLSADLRTRLSLRVEVVCVPAGGLPRYAMKARRLVRTPA